MIHPSISSLSLTAPIEARREISHGVWSFGPAAVGPSARVIERVRWSNANVNGSTDVVAAETALRNVTVPYRQLTAGSMVLQDKVSIRHRVAGWMVLTTIVSSSAAGLPRSLRLVALVIAGATLARALAESRVAVVVDLVGVRVRNMVRWTKYPWADIDAINVAPGWRGLADHVNLVLRGGSAVELRALSHTWLSRQPKLGPEFAAVLDEERASANARRILRWARP